MNEKIAKQKPLYLEVYIGPTGFNWMEFRVLDKKPDPEHRTHGEGNCLIFRLVDGDYSTNFFEALKDGELMRTIGNKFFHADISKILHGVKDG